MLLWHKNSKVSFFSVPIDDYKQESDDSILLENNVVYSVPPNTEIISVSHINIHVPACIEQLLPDIFCMYDIHINVEQQILNN